MTTQIFYDTQLNGELKKYTVDMTEFLPSGGSVASASSGYAQSFNGSSSGSMSTSVTSPYVTFTTPSFSSGLYTLGGSATLSDGQVRAFKIIVHVPA